ncbi:Actin-like protein [Beauveria bassiana ARSEF 2860]|uniref:Actin-like protein ARP6 n=1 Tax=Beauveria bassiana (strain ARSEF 2860) TaxID=655819 RepID=J5JYZ3_BEAB2|nr:Actin-like protein [Beauveria bassiana ARSEF 2860]EJP67366.1 Actin-like protein [Beauveria bassiana ARSEF 2860]
MEAQRAASRPLSEVLPPLILGTATFNHQYHPDPTQMPYVEIVRRALDHNITAFDTSPYYGPSEVLLGDALRRIEPAPPRDSYFLITKAGRLAGDEFDYSPAWVRYSIFRSLERLGTDRLDLVYMHDVEFVSPAEVLGAVTELRRLRDQGVIQYVGISGYPVDTLASLAEMIFRETSEPIDAVLSYGHFCVQNAQLGRPELLERFALSGVNCILNASMLGMGLLTSNGVNSLPMAAWHPAPEELREACHGLAAIAATENRHLEEVAIRWSLRNWIYQGSKFGTQNYKFDTNSSFPPRIGASVMGVSTVDQLEETWQLWQSVTNEQVQDATNVLVEKQMWPSLGEWKDFAWKSGGPSFINTRKVMGVVPNDDIAKRSGLSAGRGVDDAKLHLSIHMAGGKKGKVSALPPKPRNTFVLDNGASTLKAGFVRDGRADEPRIIPNCIARDRTRKIYVASELERCTDFGEMQFRRPVEKGFIVNWEVQSEIWDYEFFGSRAPLQCDPSETRLVLAEPPNGLPVLQSNCDQIVFEEYGFESYYRGVGPAFNAYHDAQSLFRTPTDTATAANIPAEILLVVDSGYSHTTVTPVFRGRPLHSAVRRLDVGGKLLTNYMARQISLRHFDVRSDPHIVNEMKELACFVSLDFKRDLERCWKGTRGQTRPEYVSGAIAKDYILPDFHKKLRGSVRDYDPANHTKVQKLAAAQADEDVLTLRNERFAIPEILFNPSDIGMRQPGIADLIHQSIHDLPVGLWPGLLANIVLVGGNALFDGFVQRLQKEVVQRVPDDCVVRVARPADPVLSTWAGAANLACHADIEKLAVTKQQYDEYGQAWLARKFLTGPGTL